MHPARFLAIHARRRTVRSRSGDQRRCDTQIVPEVDMNTSTNTRSIRTPVLAAALAMSTLALAGCATSGGSSGYAGSSGYGSSQTACYDCGTVVRIEEGSGSRTPNATGAVVGAVIGGLAAREIADNQTDSEGRKNTATVAGAAAGGVIGNAIQNRAGTGYNIFVRMRDGREVVVSQDDLNGIAVGSRVEVRNGRARLI
jgi:outer membrane lipoprotein SlyB